jgi:hypothetical protein
VEGASVSFTFRRCELSPRPDHAECVERVRQERERDAHYGRHRSGYDRGPIEREGYIEREHAIDFEAGDPSEYDREAREKTLERPDSYTNNAGVVELPYEEDVWQGLLAMKRSVDDLHARVGELIGRADFRDKLKRFAASGATPLLGDGSSDSGSP